MAGRSLEVLKKRYNSSAPDPKRGPGPGGPRGGGPRGGMMAKGKPKNTAGTIKRLFSYIGNYKGRLVLVFLSMVFRTVAQLASGYMLRPIINDFLDKENGTKFGNLTLFIEALLVLAVIYLTGVVFTYLQNRLMLTVSQSAIEKIRNDLFNKLQSLPVKFFDTENKGEIMSRFTNDVDNIAMMLDTSIISFVSGVITIVGTVCLMFYTNIWLSIVTVLFTPVFVLAGKAITKRSRKYYSAQQAALGAVNGYIEETVTGQKVVKVFNHEDECEDEFGKLNADLRDKQLYASFFGGVMGPILGNLSQINYAVTAGVGGVLYALGKFDPGGLAVFVGYARQFSMPINELSMQVNTIFSALAGAERVFDVMDRDPEIPDAPDAVDMQEMQGHVVFNNVSFGYVPEKTVLKNISLYAKPGQKIAFVGSTGAGKTTVTNLVNRFYDVNEGEITIDGVNIKDIKRDTLRSKIAMVLQDTHLFTGTVMENIRYGRPDATDEEVVQAAKTASAHSFIMKLDKGYQTMLEGDGANLSQGQRQLLNIARAAISKAPILILDEATSSVDTRTERHIEKGMDRLMENRTTFVIAHRLSTVRNANAIIVLEKGMIVERGDHDELLQLKGRYYELYTGMAELN